jgi:hypothetical protein
MNHAAELAARLSQHGPEAGLPGKHQPALVYRLEKQNMTVKLFSRCDGEPIVELALGAEARSFPLSEFIHFWLTMIEVGLNRDMVELRAGKAPERIRRKTP